MVVYDLCCAEEHVFEAWFADSATFAELSASGEIECPLCGDRKIDRAPMAPNISTHRGPTTASIKASTALAMKALTTARALIEQNCDHVGKRFAEEARKIHYGEATQRSIYGEATPEEAEVLREEGIEFGEIPFPMNRPDA